MKLWPLVLFLSIITGYTALGQTSQATAVDTLSIHPNTVRISGQVLSAAKKSAVIKIEQIVGHGTAVVNPLAVGQEVTVQLPETETRLVPNEKIMADLKEKIGIDASLSSYSLIRVLRLNRAK